MGYKAILDLSQPVVFEEYAGIGGFCGMDSSDDDTHTSVPLRTGPVTLKRNAICYSGVIVSPGVTIGENARVGAYSLVNKDVEADTFVGGVLLNLVSTLKS